MDVLHRTSAGLDVHQAQITACIRITPKAAVPHAHSKVFATTPTGLTALRDWLLHWKTTHVAMEGTGVYWLPIYTVLEAAGLDLTLCNAYHVKNVPGRKTDQSDAAWLAQLMAAGLLRKSFVPPMAIRELRELTRARVHRVEDRGRVVNTIHRQLERCGIKLCSILSDLQGKTGRAVLDALVRGDASPDAMSELAKGTVRTKRAQLAEVLTVPLTATARLLLGQHLEQLRQLDAQITALDTAINVQVAPYQAAIEHLRTLPGIEKVAAAAILAEIGPDMSAFTDGDALAAWAGLTPGQHESAGKRKAIGTRHGNRYLRRILVQVAMNIGRQRADHDLKTFFRKKLIRGYKKAAVATAHKILVRIWRMLHSDADYAPPKPVTASQRAKQTKRLIERLRALGQEVTLHPIAA